MILLKHASTIEIDKCKLQIAIKILLNYFTIICKPKQPNAKLKDNSRN